MKELSYICTLKNKIFLKLHFYIGIAIVLWFVSNSFLYGQMPGGNSNVPPTGEDLFNKDTTQLEQVNKWDDTPPIMYFTTFNTDFQRHEDTSIGRFHHFQHIQPFWGKDLGNEGSAIKNLFFTPYYQPGMSLGYQAFDMHRIQLDSLRLYNTTKPYSIFGFLIGGQAEQHASIMHTQNIQPKWNMAFELGGHTSEGYYQFQKTNSFNASFTSNYQSENDKYNAAIGLVYNRFKQQENGGIANDSFLTNPAYNNRKIIPVALPPYRFSGNLAAVTNTLSNIDFAIKHSYAAWGVSETLYNEDSTAASYQYTPRLTLKHQFHIHFEKYIYQDKAPDSLRYTILDEHISFILGDSVFSAQKWFFIDNKFSLNGYIGKAERLMHLEAGVGTRTDRFATDVLIRNHSETILSNYIFGNIGRVKAQKKQWDYAADAQLYFTGRTAGNFKLSASARKEFGKWIFLRTNLSHVLTNAPYSWENFITNYYERKYDFGKISWTQIAGELQVPLLKLYGGVKNQLIANYLYFDTSLVPQQQTMPFSLIQVFVRKDFRLGIMFSENEIVWQQPTNNAPVNIPLFMLRHILRVETPIFSNAIHFSAGIEGRYHSSYYAHGYVPYFNQFYYQNTYQISNRPELALFFNFKVKGFRAFVLGEHLQQLIWTNSINALGYPAQNAMLRFGFNWSLIN